MKFNDKDLFVKKLRRFANNGGSELYDLVYAHKGYSENRGERILAGAIAVYLEESTPGESEGINWYAHLHKYMTEAFVEFRARDRWRVTRDEYREATGEEIPDLINVHVGGLHRMLTADKLAHLATVLSGELWLQDSLKRYFSAQQTCIDQAWGRFVRVGYRELMARGKKETHRGNSGTFGSTTLMTYELAGRVMFTFQRSGATVTFVADAEDMHGHRSGANVSSTPYAECVAMINEVSDSWRLDVMKKDDKIGMR